MAKALGVDIGGTGIKGAPVDVVRGAFAADRVRILTPSPATPDAVTRTVGEVLGGLLIITDTAMDSVSRRALG